MGVRSLATVSPTNCWFWEANPKTLPVTRKICLKGNSVVLMWKVIKCQVTGLPLRLLLCSKQPIWASVVTNLVKHWRSLQVKRNLRAVRQVCTRLANKYCCLLIHRMLATANHHKSLSVTILIPESNLCPKQWKDLTSRKWQLYPISFPSHKQVLKSWLKWPSG